MYTIFSNLLNHMLWREWATYFLVMFLFHFNMYLTNIKFDPRFSFPRLVHMEWLWKRRQEHEGLNNLFSCFPFNNLCTKRCLNHISAFIETGSGRMKHLSSVMCFFNNNGKWKTAPNFNWKCPLKSRVALLNR